MDETPQPKPAVRFEISRSLNGHKIVYIARDPYGIVRLRSENMENMEKLIFEYRLPEPPKPAVDREAIVEAKIDTLVEAVVAAQAEEDEKKKPVKKAAGSPLVKTEEAEATETKVFEEKKEFLKNELKDAIEEQKDKTEKKSFWDRLK